MDALVFMEFLEFLTEKLEEKVDEVRFLVLQKTLQSLTTRFTFQMNGKNDTLKLKDFLEEDKKPNTAYRTEDEYLKITEPDAPPLSISPKESQIQN